MFEAILAGATGLFGAASASKAADAQSDAAEDQIDFSREVYNNQNKLFKPYRKAGNQAQQVLNYLNGVGPQPVFGATTPAINRVQVGQSGQGGQSFRDWALDEYGSLDWENDPGRWGHAEKAARAKYDAMGGGAYGGNPIYEYQVGDQSFGTKADAKAYAQQNATGGTPWEWQNTPGYDARLQAGLDAVAASTAMRHGQVSGASIEALERTAQDYRTNENAIIYNRLAGMAQQGQNAAAQTSAAAGQYANNTNNAFANMGNANSAGIMGVGNAITGGVNNGIGVWAYGKERGW